jgi:hypothetical protein
MHHLRIVRSILPDAMAASRNDILSRMSKGTGV